MFVVRVHARARVCVIGMAGARERDRGSRRRLEKEQRRRVLEPLSFLRAVQLLLQHVLLRLSHLVSTLSIPCSYLLLFILLLLLLLLRLLPTPPPLLLSLVPSHEHE